MSTCCTSTEIRAERGNETTIEFCDQSGAAEALWAYPTGPRIEDVIQWLAVLLRIPCVVWGVVYVLVCWGFGFLCRLEDEFDP